MMNTSNFDRGYFDNLTNAIVDSPIQDQNDPNLYWKRVVSFARFSSIHNFEDFLKTSHNLKEFCDLYENSEISNKDPILVSLMLLFQFQLKSLQNQIIQVSHDIQNQIVNNLSRSLLDQVDYFDSNSYSVDPYQAISNIISEIEQVMIFNFQSRLSPLILKVKNLQSLLDQPFQPDPSFTQPETFNIEEFSSDIKKTFCFIMAFKNIGDQTERNFTLKFKEKMNPLFSDIQKVIQEIDKCFQANILPYIIQIDHYLQCSYIVALMNTSLSHPTAKVFAQVYCIPPEQLPSNAYDPLITSFLENPDENQEKTEQIEKIIDEMGKTRQDEFKFAADLIYKSRNSFNLFFENYKQCYKQSTDDDLLSIITTKLDDPLFTINNVHLAEKKFNFRPEFERYQNMSMNEVYKQFNELLSSLASAEDNDETMDEENQNQNENHAEEEEIQEQQTDDNLLD